MKTVDGLTDQATQQTAIVLDDGTRAVLTLNFKPQQTGWFFDITWGGRSISGQRLVASPNILRQYLNQLPFGLAVICANDGEPDQSETFVDGSTLIYLLQGVDLTDVETLIYGAPMVAAQPVTPSSGTLAPILPASWGPAGGDLRGTYPNPSVIAFHDGANTRLPFGTIPEGKYLRRVGGIIVGDNGGTGTGDVSGPGSSIDDDLAVWDGVSGTLLKDGGIKRLRVTVAPVTATPGHLAVFGASPNLIVDGGAPGGGSAIGIRNRSALRAYTGMVDKQFLLEEGYGFEGDGGGGMWFFVLADNYSTDNDGTLVVPGGVYGDPATAGCWHRGFPGTQGASVLTSTTLDIRWFGALPNDADCTPGLRHAFAALFVGAGEKQLGTLRAPGGEYRFSSKVVFDCTALAFSFIGDGAGSTDFLYGMTGSDTCMIEVKNAVGGGLWGFRVKYVGGFSPVSNPSTLWIHDNIQFTVENVNTEDMQSTDLTGGIFRIGANNSLTMNNCKAEGNGSAGTCLLVEGGSGFITNCKFLNATDESFPACRFSGFNTLQWSNNFVQGGGPLRKFAGATIVATGSAFTVDAGTAHGFVNGQYFLLRGASNALFNTTWKVVSHTTNTITATSSISATTDTATLSTLWSCLYFGSATDVCTESMFDNTLLNTGGMPGAGSCGVWIDGFSNVGAGGLQFDNFDVDYGACAFFLHGLSFLSSGIPGSTVGSCMITNCRPNGGPRDAFGSIRLEGVVDISIQGYQAFPGGTGILSAIVISDGGQAHLTQDINITGGILTNTKSSALYPSATIQAIECDGANVHNVSAWNPGVDASKTVLSLINSAAAANGITVGYANNAGRFALIDSTGTHNL